MSSISVLCQRIALARWFENLTIGVIVFNAILLGLETYPSLAGITTRRSTRPPECASPTSRWRS